VLPADIALRHEGVELLVVLLDLAVQLHALLRAFLRECCDRGERRNKNGVNNALFLCICVHVCM
jgi:hypothetical protein